MQITYLTHSNRRPLTNSRSSSKIQIEDPPIKQDCNNKRPSIICFTYSFVLISVCNCNVDGSIGTSCDANGICSCKVNYMNDKCDECNFGFLSLPMCDTGKPGGVAGGWALCHEKE